MGRHAATEPTYYPSRQAYCIRWQGKQHLLAAGPENAETKARATARFAELQHCNDTPASNLTAVSTVLDSYIVWLKRNRKATTVKIAGGWRDKMIEQWPTLKVSELKPGLVEDWLDEHPTWGANSRRMAIGTLQAALNRAFRQGTIASNPVAGKIEMPPPVSRADDSVITHFEHAQILAYASKYLHPIMVLVHATGARPSEIAQAEAKFWLPKFNAFKLPSDPANPKSHKRARSGKRRVIYIPEPLVPIVTAAMERFPTGNIFRTQKGANWTAETLATAFNAAKRKSPVRRPVTLYSYRHFFCTTFLKCGGPGGAPGSMPVLAALVGTSIEMLSETYGHLEGMYRDMREISDNFAGNFKSPYYEGFFDPNA